MHLTSPFIFPACLQMPSNVDAEPPRMRLCNPLKPQEVLQGSGIIDNLPERLQ